MEYVSKEEVIDLLKWVQDDALWKGDQKAVDALNSAQKQIKRMQSFDPVSTARWKLSCHKGNTIYCSECDFTTLLYKNTKYCPQCGKLMVNGVAHDRV